jgi:hypothetical protein
MQNTKLVELTLAISIILSNLSNDQDYIKVLLGVEKWDKKPSSSNVEEVDGENFNPDQNI